jgi:hypothetical protein
MFMKNNIFLLTIKGLTSALIIFFCLAILFNDFAWENGVIIIIPLLILNTVSLFVTLLLRVNLSKTISLGLLFVDMLIYIFLFYYLRLFLAFGQI